MRRIIRTFVGSVLVLVAIVCAVSGLQSWTDGPPARAAGQLVGTGLLTLIVGTVGVKMILRRAPS
ncbi:MAG: hypothetical protein WD669_13275 [Pirellulales bacterium]